MGRMVFCQNLIFCRIWLGNNPFFGGLAPHHTFKILNSNILFKKKLDTTNLIFQKCQITFIVCCYRVILDRCPWCCLVCVLGYKNVLNTPFRWTIWPMLLFIHFSDDTISQWGRKLNVVNKRVIKFLHLNKFINIAKAILLLQRCPIL